MLIVIEFYKSNKECTNTSVYHQLVSFFCYINLDKYVNDRNFSFLHIYPELPTVVSQPTYKASGKPLISLHILMNILGLQQCFLNCIGCMALYNKQLNG
jgi:hypothetical protein